MIDAHNHLHDTRLAPHRAPMLEDLAHLGIERAVVNGTRESDWPAVSALAAEVPWVLPSYGLHPWHVRERSAHYLATLSSLLHARPEAAVGEIGLDRWIEGHDLADQTSVFTAQLALAAERDLPASIHCIQAWGALAEVMRTRPLPARGFLLHAFGGSLEMMHDFASRGGYFSFPPYFLHERKSAQRAVFAAIPEDRLLVETDAPDLRPPDEKNPHPLHDKTGAALNHPANIALAYAALAELRGIRIESLAEIVAANFARLFGR